MFLIGLINFILIAPYFLVIIQLIGQTSGASWLIPITAGTIGGFLLDFYFIRKLPGFHTFEHELTHAIAGICCGKRITEFKVTPYSGGHVVWEGPVGNPIWDNVASSFIGLAPYVMPTFTFFSVLARPIVPDSWGFWYDGWIGITFGYHVLSTISETKNNWHATDIITRGHLFSTIYIIAGNLGIHGLILAIVLMGYSGAWEWLQMVVAKVGVVLGWVTGFFGSLG